MLLTSHVVRLVETAAHLLVIESTFTSDDGPLPSPLVVWMPVWTPGSYLVREYARHVERFEVLATTSPNGTPPSSRKIRKNAWRIDHGGKSSITIRYRLYANELTVRTNHVDATHAYWNGAATFLTTDAALDAPVTIEVDLPSGWNVATALRESSGATSAPGAGSTAGSVRDASSDGHGAMRRFEARDFDELCDSPFACGPLIERTFELGGKPHRIAARDDEHARGVDWDKLVADTRTIVQTEADLVAESSGEDAALALPYDGYLFLWHVSPRGRGGLEHRTSATLLTKPDSFATRKGYLDVLSLVAHEFFHLWNVKRIRPAGLFPYRYQEECYTRLLWWFEGATSYYDWRVLRLAGLATPAEYLGHVADECARLEDTPGALVHPLEEASFDAWIKLYRPDENTPNSTVSYYLKGEIVCALLDLEIRARSSGRACLDDVVRRLWSEHGAREIAVPEDGLTTLIESVAGVSLDDRFTSWLRRAEPVDVSSVLALAGLRFERTRSADAPRVGIGVRVSVRRGVTVVDTVLRGGAAERAGIEANDEIVAVFGRRVSDGKLDATLGGLDPGATVPVVVTRDGKLRTLDVVLGQAPAGDGKIVARKDATAAERALCEAWLACSFAAVPAANDER